MQSADTDDVMSRVLRDFKIGDSEAIKTLMSLAMAIEDAGWDGFQAAR